MVVCIHWQVHGVVNHLNNYPLNFISCALAIIPNNCLLGDE
jgi:hypothetical protein